MRVPVWHDSERLWENVLKQYPESPRAWTNKGLIYYDTKEWNKVVDDLSKALDADPQYANALEWRARAYIELNEGEKAFKDAELFYRSYPENPAALFAMARAYEITGKYEEAVAMYNLLIPKAPNVPEYLNNRGALFFNKLQRYEDAKKDFEQCIALSPDTGLYYLNLSRCYYVMGDYGNAKIHAEKARSLGETIDPAYAGVIGL
jgi:tetratricopeptide (TPR) repeat protein